MSGVDLPGRRAFAVVLTVAVVAGAGVWWASGSPATPDAVDRGGTSDAVGLQATPAGDATPIDSCTALTEPGRYVLDRDLVDRNASTCIAIRSSDVVLDGTGHRIDGRGTFGTAGIVVGSTGPGTETLSNVTVRDVTVTGWDDGVRFIGVAGGRLESATAADNRVGVTLLSARRVTVVDTVARSNRLRGFSLVEESANNTLRNDTAAGNDLFGFHLVEPGVRNNTLVGNDASQNEYGFVLVGASDNELRRNEAGENRIAGIFLSSASGNVLEGNAVSNRFYGIFLSDGSNGNVVADNTADANPVGIRLRSSDGNVVVSNDVRKSSDIAILLISSDDNRVVDNVGSQNARGVAVIRSTGNVVANNSVG